jgi:CDP-glucose 4,6-dehydratase
MEACRTRDVARVVVASSSRVYGTTGRADGRGFSELDPLHGREVYGVSKAAADMIARSYWESHGVRVAAARLSNVYGGGDLDRARLVPELVAAVLRDEAPVLRSDGTPQREFLYVEDAAAAYLAIADALDRGDDAACGAAFNAAGPLHEVRDIAETLLRLAGSGARPDIRGADTVSDRLSLDCSRLRDLTGWRAQVDLEDGLGRTLEWYRAHPGALDLS